MLKISYVDIKHNLYVNKFEKMLVFFLNEPSAFTSFFLYCEKRILMILIFFVGVVPKNLLELGKFIEKRLKSYNQFLFY